MKVSEWLDALIAGHVTVSEVAANFRTRKWVERVPEERSFGELLAWTEAAQDDFPLPESFEEVDSLYNHGQLSNEDFWVLWEAAVQARGIRVR